jgi:hypothetical protein
LELIPEGLIVKNDPDANYLLLEYEGVSQNDLFSKIASYLEKGLAKNKKEMKMNHVIKTRPSSIIINGYGKNVLAKTDNLIYNMSIMVKDGKVRINMPTFTTHPERLKEKIFKKDGRVNDAKLKKQIEDFLNAIITDIDNILSVAALENNGEDW